MIVRTATDMLTRSEAWFSDCEQYRYLLRYVWSDAPRWLFLGCNPSTATHLKLDATLTRMRTRAERAGAGGFDVGNVAALRSTKPDGMKMVPDPVGPENDTVLSQLIAENETIICGWGNHPLIRTRALEVLAMIRAAGKTPSYLKLNADGSPTHPLYVPYSLGPTPWEARCAA